MEHTSLSMMHVNTEWERLLARFILVAATFLLAAPWNIKQYGILLSYQE